MKLRNSNKSQSARSKEYAPRRWAQSNNTATGFDSIVGFKLDQRLVIERSGSYLSF